MARADNITSLFGKSPIAPLQKHMKQAHSCLKDFAAFAQAADAQDWDKADKLKKKLRMNLPSTFMMPFSRRDLLDVLLIQDSIANITKDLAGLMMTRHIVFPEEISSDFIKLAGDCIKTSAAALAAINELDALLETAFGSRERKVVDKMIKEVNRLEHETDDAQNDIRNKLFDLESSLPPVDVMFYYRAIEWLGETADAAQKVGSRFEVMLTK